MKKNRTPIYI